MNFQNSEDVGRARARRRFIWRLGVFYWGGFCAGALVLKNAYADDPSVWKLATLDIPVILGLIAIYSLIYVPIFMLGGYMFGVAMWKFFEMYFGKDFYKTTKMFQD